MTGAGAWRVSALTVALLLQLHPGAVAASGDPATTFVRIAKREISGKSGRVVKSVEVLPDGIALLRDGADKTLATARLSPDDLGAFQQLLADPATLAGTPECGAPMGADLSSAELVVQQPLRTVVVKVERHCRLPAPLDRLRAMLEDVERKYLSRR